MQQQKYVEMLEQHGVKPTANRLLVLAVLCEAEHPLSLKEIEGRVASIDKSGVFRTLSVFRNHHLIHVIDGAENGVRYELCHNHTDDADNDLHLHFFCENCKKTYCLETPIPNVYLPEGFEARYGNYIIKGICPKCGKR
ncbi:MAG: transcriptional repressor [Bacteroidales bacterium]|jgi:Fur family ferric uptake transcriptional regulator|nr:transcriptional repressor [Bacteroidales bacterium]